MKPPVLFSTQRHGFSPRKLQRCCVVNKVVLGELYLQVLLFSPLSIILSMTHIYASVLYHRRHKNSEIDSVVEQTANKLILSIYLCLRLSRGLLP